MDPVCTGGAVDRVAANSLVAHTAGVSSGLGLLAWVLVYSEYVRMCLHWSCWGIVSCTAHLASLLDSKMHYIHDMYYYYVKEIWEWIIYHYSFCSQEWRKERWRRRWWWYWFVKFWIIKYFCEVCLLWHIICKICFVIFYSNIWSYSKKFKLKSFVKLINPYVKPFVSFC